MKASFSLLLFIVFHVSVVAHEFHTDVLAQYQLNSTTNVTNTSQLYPLEDIEGVFNYIKIYSICTTLGHDGVGTAQAMFFDSEGNQILRVIGCSDRGTSNSESTSDTGELIVPIPTTAASLQLLTKMVSTSSSGSDATIIVQVLGKNLDTLDFSSAVIQGYPGQNQSNNYTIEGSNNEQLTLNQNTWLVIDAPYNVTSDTIIEFDFLSTSEGEVHAIGFYLNDGNNFTRGFQLFGTQNWSNQNHNDYGANLGQWKTYRIAVGQYYTGSFAQLFIANDDDTQIPTSSSSFRNIRIFEQ